MLWTLKHAPKNLSQICGNAEATSRIKKWALSFSLGKATRPLLLHGPCGSAKSACASALANELEMEITNITVPQNGDTERWEKQLSELLGGSSLFGNSILVVCEDIDQWHLSRIRGIVQTFARKLADVKIPVLITAQDPYDRRIASVRPYCELVQLKSINAPSIQGTLAKIASDEGLHMDKGALQKIAINSHGDLRAAINDLQAHNPNSSREGQKQQLEILRSVFRSPSYSAAKTVDLGPLMERSTLKLYASENITNELFDSQDAADGFNYLSRADVFDGRIMRRQYWGYLRYSSLLLLWGVSSCRRHIRAGFTPYSFPAYLRKMGASRSRRATCKNAGLKIGQRCHCTQKHAQSFIPLICAQMANSLDKAQSGQRICAHYRFDEEELAALCGATPVSLYSQTPARAKNSKRA